MKMNTAIKLPKLLMCGHGRSGKDTACEYLSKISLLRNAGTTSKYLCKEVARRLGLSEDEAYQRRHESDEMRIQWYNIGNEVRANGPTTLIRQALEHGEISGGIRDYEEIIACRKEGLVDLIVWIQNDRVPTDPTVKFTSKECDIVIENNWSIEEFQNRLKRLAKFANLPLSYGMEVRERFSNLPLEYSEYGSPISKRAVEMTEGIFEWADKMNSKKDPKRIKDIIKCDNLIQVLDTVNN